MKAFIDLAGASGRLYRFTLCPNSGPATSMAGNYAFVRSHAGGFELLQLGVANDLTSAMASWPAATERGATHLYIRLNVARAARWTEHADIAKNHGSGLAVEELYDQA